MLLNDAIDIFSVIDRRRQIYCLFLIFLKYLRPLLSQERENKFIIKYVSSDINS